MKSLGTEPSSRSSRTIHWLALGAAATFCGALTLQACITAGTCDDGCGEDTGGGGSGGGGSGGEGPSDDPVLMAAVENCDAYPTVGDVETKLLKPKCGTGSACHAASGTKFPPQLSTAKMYERMFDKASSQCGDSGDKLIDPADATKSILGIKPRPEPKCSDGDSAGDKMPPKTKPQLNEAEVTCIQEYVKAVITAKAP